MQVLCRILCRFGEVVIGHLEVAVLGHFGRIADPCTNHMQGIKDITRTIAALDNTDAIDLACGQLLESGLHTEEVSV